MKLMQSTLLHQSTEKIPENSKWDNELIKDPQKNLFGTMHL
jgi:hypothetical protein